MHLKERKNGNMGMNKRMNKRTREDKRDRTSLSQNYFPVYASHQTGLPSRRTNGARVDPVSYPQEAD